MALEQTIKDLQAQNSQFQQMFLNLAKGQENLKALIIKERKNKTKKPVVLLNMGRKFKGPVWRALDFEVPSNEDDNQEEDDKSVKAKDNNYDGPDEEEAYYSDEHYPSVDDKYKQLEDRLNAMEI